RVARRLEGLDNVVGYDTLNEPAPGYIGWPDLSAADGLLRLGDSPTPFQSMMLGAGYSLEIEIWSVGIRGPRRKAQRMVNVEAASAWLEGHPPLWREHGVWDLDGQGRPRLLRPDYFSAIDGRRVDFAADHLRPFMERYARTIRAVDPGAIIFLEAPPRLAPPAWDTEALPRVVHAAHWYDGLTLLTKTYIPNMGVDYASGGLVVGRRRVRRSFARQLGQLKTEAEEHLGGAPTLLGEFGIPFDLRGGRAYDRGDFGQQVQALDDTFQALEANLLSGTLWNYTADNDNQRGDQWNGEDLSIFSRDQQDDPDDLDSGGRALASAVRPYAQAVAGEPLSMTYNPGRREFEFEFRHDETVEAPTELYVPNLHYPDGYVVHVSDGEYTVDRENQRLIYRHTGDQSVHSLRLRPAKGQPRRRRRGRR
ncbi:MAG: hypothetical protein P8129_19040, partial [Anaerolineae bacterium]